MTTLDDIVAAAAKVFRTKGYHAATVRHIADEVGILKSAVFTTISKAKRLCSTLSSRSRSRKCFRILPRSPKPIYPRRRSFATQYWRI